MRFVSLSLVVIVDVDVAVALLNTVLSIYRQERKINRTTRIVIQPNDENHGLSLGIGVSFWFVCELYVCVS